MFHISRGGRESASRVRVDSKAVDRALGQRLSTGTRNRILFRTSVASDERVDNGDRTQRFRVSCLFWRNRRGSGLVYGHAQIATARVHTL